MSGVPSGLSPFQDAFAHALLATVGVRAASEVAGLVTQPGFAVYRNTVMKGCVDAVQANFPTIEQLVGEEWLRAAAARFVSSTPPTQPALIEFGAGFSEFLRNFEPAAEFPYLADVAHIDRLWTEAHIAADAELLPPSAIAALSPESVATARLRLHPAARWARFGTPALTIWQRHRAGGAVEGDIDWNAEAALMTRPHGAVLATHIDEAGCAVLDACAAALPLAAAAQSALALDPKADLAALLITLLNAGAFSALELENSR